MYIFLIGEIAFLRFLSTLLSHFKASLKNCPETQQTMKEFFFVKPI